MAKSDLGADMDLQPASFKRSTEGGATTEEESESAALQVQPDDDVASYVRPDYTSGTDMFDEEDTSYLRLRLAQSNTSEVAQRTAEIGDLVMTGFPAMKKIAAVPVLFARMRAYSTGAGAEKQVFCVSSDGIHGQPNKLLVAELPVKPSGVCGEQTCPCAKWTPNPRTPGKNRPPLCDTIYSYILWVEELQTLCDLRLKKTQVNAAKMINNLASARGFGRFAVELYCTKQYNDKAKDGFAVPQVVVINGYDPKVLKRARVAAGTEPDTTVTEEPQVAEGEYTTV